MVQFRFLNIPVFIQPTFWLFLLFFCFEAHRSPLQLLIVALVVCFSLLFHEYGHALIAQKFRQTPEITLEGVGGYAAYEGRGLSDREHFLITLGGPLFTALLIGASYYLFTNRIFTGVAPVLFCYYIMKLNIYWLIVNLAPLNPFDGGKIANYFLRKWFGRERGYRWSLMLGNVTAVVGGSYFFLNENYLFAYLFFFHGWNHLQVYLAEK